jgi:glycosyltransferase involved in cell wall biosynthesis
MRHILMESLKICHVSLTFPPVLSGISTAIESVCKELAKRGHEVEVLTVTIKKTYFVKANEKLYDDSQYNFVIKRFNCASLPILAQLNFSKKVGEYLATKDFDVIHLHSPLILPPKGNHRFYVTMHNIIKSDLSASNFKNWYTMSTLLAYIPISHFEKRCVSEAERVICVSKATEKIVKEAYGKKDDSFEVVYNGLDPNTLVPVNLDYKTKDKDYILYTGLFIARKGIDNILKVAKILNKMDFVLVGTGPLFNKYKSMANRLGVDNVLMTGKILRFELLKRYREARIFLFPTYFDTFGISVLEAMFSGLPVVSTNVGGIPELITHEVEGILVPPGDIDAMVKWIRKLMNDECLRERLAKAAKDKANKEFTIEKNVDKLLELYKNRSKVS